MYSSETWGFYEQKFDLSFERRSFPKMLDRYRKTDDSVAYKIYKRLQVVDKFWGNRLRWESHLIRIISMIEKEDVAEPFFDGAMA